VDPVVLRTLGELIRYPLYESPDAIAIADMNGDDRDDVTITHGWQRAGVLLQRPDGWLGNKVLTGQLPPASSFTPLGLAVADINDDDLNDLLMANCNAGLVVSSQEATASATPLQHATARSSVDRPYRRNNLLQRLDVTDGQNHDTARLYPPGMGEYGYLVEWENVHVGDRYGP
jgi:hypothetical protein